MEINDDESLGFINRLLERLHQAGFGMSGNLTLVYVANGAQHVQNQYNIGACPDTLQGRETGHHASKPIDAHIPLPKLLSTESAMLLWQKAQQAGFVDADYQPKLSRTQAALLADAMAHRLSIKEKWKVFEVLWQRKNMYRDYYEALNQKKSLEFQDKLKKLFH